MTKLLFLPGAGASASFWRPMAERLTVNGPRRFFAWPGLGDEPPDPDVRGIDDLVAMVLAELQGPTDLVAQSMGGLVAARAALEAPHRVRRMVLVATSAGVPMAEFGASDWREAYFSTYPAAARWISAAQEDLSARLVAIKAPVLLIWGGADPVSPPSVGERLQRLLPHARLEVIPGGDHDLARTHAEEVAALVEAHLR